MRRSSRSPRRSSITYPPDHTNRTPGPILEPTEYGPRFTEWFNGTSDCLQFPGQLIALALVVWAASYGINEGGEEMLEFRDEDMQQRKERINEMLQELLYLVDIHGILRKPTWDGVRALLLIMPLTEGLLSLSPPLLPPPHLISPQRSRHLSNVWYVSSRSDLALNISIAHTSSLGDVRHDNEPGICTL